MKPWGLGCAILLAGCGGPQRTTVIDGSTADTFEQSVEDAREQLSPRDRLKFEAALNAVRGRQFDASVRGAEFDASIRRLLNGKSAAQVVAGVEQWNSRFGGTAPVTTKK